MNITTDPIGIKKLPRDYYEQYYGNQVDSLVEMDNLFIVTNYQS